MTARTTILLLVTGLSLLACDGETGIEDTDETFGGGDTDNNDDDDDDDEEEEEIIPFDPVAVGVEFEAGLDPIFKSEFLIYRYQSAAETFLRPLVTLSVTNIDYFSLPAGSTEEDRNANRCQLLAEFDYVIDDTPPTALAFDYESGTGFLSESYQLNFFAEGAANIIGYSALLDETGEVVRDADGILVPSNNCQQIIDQGVYDQLDGMHLGIGFGPMSDFMRTELFDDYADFEEDQIDAIAGAYIAMNHPADNEDGYNFIPTNWNYMYYFAGEIEPDSAIDADGNAFDSVLVTVDPSSSNLEFSTPFDGNFVRVFPYWYEDFPNLDLDNMKAGAPAAE
ncbi:MAG: hypothetical protein AAFV53_07195 [Myxococcota bacterium]